MNNWTRKQRIVGIFDAFGVPHDLHADGTREDGRIDRLVASGRTLGSIADSVERIAEAQPDLCTVNV